MVYNIKDSTILLKGDVMLDNRTITFLTVCKEMNYTRAAEKLNISQPAVSQHIQYMEDYYGVRLFRFIGKKLILTDAGRLLQRSLTAFHNNEIYLKACVGRVLEALKAHGGCALITADHGNADQMLAADGKSPFTAHSTKIGRASCRERV